ncbi:MAG TPA: sulfocyanin-like copper-binding protein [Acidothermaceae bacterium]|nr:sulfocyanin-like copper-binding protein [Acidothermaceae bacterium]
MTTVAAHGRRWPLLGAVVVLAAVSTLLIGAAGGGFRGRPVAATSACSAPVLSGAVVDVSLIDMGGAGSMMRRGGQSGWHSWQPGMMRVVASPGGVAGQTVSLRVSNVGVITHELVVLPLPAGQAVGERHVGSDGKVDETGSAGEVSASCAPGAGDGLRPGSTGWATLTLPAGRYELLCNLPGHYTAGMYTELDVT